jgi:serine/threonine-protein kinase
VAGTYLLLEKLGEGGTGMVYRAARLERPDRSVAVKVLTGAACRAPSWRADPALLTSLRHPHLVGVLACGEVAGRPFLEMEHVPGPTLRQALTPGAPWPAARALPLLLGLADALGYLHSRGLLHLDLKPENVLCHPAGGPRLADLDGLVPRGAGRLTWQRGSPDYCPPEQRFGLPVDERADLFALAAVGNETLAGRLPGRVFFPLTRCNPALPADADEAFRRGLARDPDERPASLPAFARLLREALGG